MASDASSMTVSDAAIGGPHHLDWIVWSFTAVIHPRGDRLSFLMGLISLFPQFLICACIGANLAAFRPRLVLLQVCLLVSELVNVVLKQWVQESRPVHPCPFAARADFGMPSSHAQLVWCAATWTALELLRSQPPQPQTQQERGKRVSGGATTTKEWNSSRLTRCCCSGVVHHHRILAFGILPFVATLVCVSRVWNDFHTTGQVVVGALVGVVMACLLRLDVIESMLMRWCVFGVAKRLLTGWHAFWGVE